MISFRERGDKAGQCGTEQKSRTAGSELIVSAKHVMGWQGRIYAPWSCAYIPYPSPGRRDAP